MAVSVCVHEGDMWLYVYVCLCVGETVCLYVRLHMCTLSVACVLYMCGGGRGAALAA